MNKTKMIYFLSAIVCIIGCYALNLSYSLFVQTEEKPVVDATVPSLSYSLETSEFTIPANSGEVVKLKVINSGTADIKYGISVTDTLETTIQLVEKENNNIVGELKASTTEGETSSKEILVYVTNPTDTDITLTFNLTAKYNTLNFDEDFIATSNIDCVNTIKLLKDAIIARANSITETESQTNGYAMYSPEPLTTPRDYMSESTEATLSIAGENEGQSYYFRGNVNDNFVNFADMCWRIVRIADDNSIKLILEDQDQLCNSKDSNGNLNMNGNWNIPTETGGSIVTGYYGYTEYEGGKLFASDGKTYNKNTLIIMDYLHGEEKKDNSIATAFKNFQNTFSNIELSQMKSGDWCLGDKGYSRSSNSGVYSYTPLSTSELLDYKVASKTFFYDIYKRTADNNGEKNLSLTCNGTTLSDWEDNTINTSNMYIGALTGDEVLFAGARWYNSTQDYYLKNSEFAQGVNGIIQSDCFWTISPFSFSTTTDLVTKVENTRGLNNANLTNQFCAFRPVINIKTNAITSGTGIMSDPYIILGVL